MAVNVTNLMAITPQEIDLAKSFSPNFLATVGAQNIKKPAEVLVSEILNKIPDPDERFLASGSKSGDKLNVDTDLKIPSPLSAKTDLAFISYMLSSYYKSEKINQNGAKRYRYTVNKASNNNLPQGSFEFFSLKNTPLNTNAVEIVTDQDMIHASILGLNMMVKGMREDGMAAMHPLSRVAASEANIGALSDFISTNSSMSIYDNLMENNKYTAVKLYNTACTRKAHQFYGQTKFYCPELAAATLITGVMSSRKVSSGLIKIANSSLQKISRSSGSLDTNLVINLMEFTVGSGSALDAEQIFNMYKSQKAQYVYVPQQAKATGLVAYEAKSPFPNVAQTKPEE
nr:MAG: nucleocapsid protein [Sanya sesamia inferens phasmavirus 1]UHM27574.1 MAG: nucleocapsid protein [Sanya Bunyavirales-like virus 1]UHM27683.1 MAG: nucleocapsid protein [Fushun Phasmavirus 3]